MTVGLIAAAVFAPCWWPSLKRYHGAVLFFVGGVLIILAEIWLTSLSSIDHAISLGLLTNNLALVAGLIFAIAAILWARENMPLHRVAILFAGGMLVDVALGFSDPLFLSNPWKFGLSTPVTVIALALAMRAGSRWLELLVIVLAAGAAALNDGRSSFGILALAFILTIVQLGPSRQSRRSSTTRLVVALGGLGVIVYNVGQALILDGYLGDAARQRSMMQIETSGSLILGGRPELAATVALMQHNPIGYGAGTLPNLSDVLVAKSGMASIGYQPNNGYVENYMFGGQYELHSVIADLWVKAGPIGIVFAVLTATLVIRAVSSRLSARTESSLILFLMAWFLWNLFFSPLYGSVPLTAMVVGFALKRRAAVASDLIPSSGIFQATSTSQLALSRL